LGIDGEGIVVAFRLPEIILKETTMADIPSGSTIA
jgi:hypothetical protein